MLTLGADETECLTVTRREWKAATGKRAGYSRYPEERTAARLCASAERKALGPKRRWMLKAGSCGEAPAVGPIPAQPCAYHRHRDLEGSIGGVRAKRNSAHRSRRPSGYRLAPSRDANG